jgi:hypothetical protein
MDKTVSIGHGMIVEEKKWMTYTYFNHDPRSRWNMTHLFSPRKRNLSMMKCIPFPTMIVDLREQAFVEGWSKSTKYKITRAEKEGLTVDRGNYLLPDILKLFSATATLKGLNGYKSKDFDSFPWIECSAVLFEGVMLCSHVWMIDKDEKRAMMYVSASNHHNENDDKSLTGRAHYFLLWQDGLYLRSQGLETMDLMGYESDSANQWMKGVYQWKAGTHGKQETLYHYYPLWFYGLRKFRNMLTG